MLGRVQNVVAVIAVVVLVGAGCIADLDSFVWNPRNCKIVDKASTDCTVKHVCSTCDEPYDFTVFGIPADAVTQVAVTLLDKETLDAYFIASDGTRPDDVVIYAHGNFGGLEHYLNRVGFVYATGVNVFAIDYRGFGKSSTEEEPSDEAKFNDDEHRTRDALDAVLTERGLDPATARITTYGYSGGALASVEISKYRAPCGVILEAPFPSVQAFTDDSTFVGVPQSFISSGQWDNISKMPDITAPLLQLHGTDDDFVRLDVGKLVFDAANDPKKLVEVDGAGHGNGGRDVPEVLGAAYAENITTFIDGLDCGPNP